MEKWNIPKKEQEIILNGIEAHHGKTPLKSLTAEVIRNAECFKFVTVKGSLIWLHELGLRGFSYEESIKEVLGKMEEKRRLLTLPDCKKEAEKNIKKIKEIFK